MKKKRGEAWAREITADDPAIRVRLGNRYFACQGDGARPLALVFKYLARDRRAGARGI